MIFERMVLKLIDENRFVEARECLASCSRSDNTENRVCGFLESQILLREGSYAEAIEVLEQTQKNYGDHISILTNLATCHYLLGDFIAWKEVLLVLDDTYAKVKEQLGPYRRSNTLVLRAQFAEEEAQSSLALELFEEAMAVISPIEEKALYYKCVMQLLRISGIFKLKHKTAHYYSLLVQLREQSPNQYLSIEAQHALMLAELSLFGPAMALARRNKLLASELSAYDKRLIVFDFEEMYILAEGKASGLFVLSDVEFDSLDPFEKAFASLLTASEGKVADDFILQNLPLTRQLVLGAVQIRIFSDNGMCLEASRRLKCLLEVLSGGDRKLWARRLRVVATDNDTVEVAYNKRDGYLKLHDKEVCLKRRPQLTSLLDALCENTTLDSQELAKTMWKAKNPESSAYFHRLRNLAYRLNEMGSTELGVEKLVEVSKQSFLLNPKILIQLV